jgi:hypothetical protein
MSQEQTMNQQDYTALRVTVLVRTEQGTGPIIEEHFDSVPFQYQLQDALGNLVKDSLKAAELQFEEVIISLDAPAEQAEKVEQKKSSLMGRLFGR